MLLQPLVTLAILPSLVTIKVRLFGYMFGLLSCLVCDVRSRFASVGMGIGCFTTTHTMSSPLPVRSVLIHCQKFLNGKFDSPNCTTYRLRILDHYMKSELAVNS